MTCFKNNLIHAWHDIRQAFSFLTTDSAARLVQEWQQARCSDSALIEEYKSRRLLVAVPLVPAAFFATFSMLTPGHTPQDNHSFGKDLAIGCVAGSVVMDRRRRALRPAFDIASAQQNMYKLQMESCGADHALKAMRMKNFPYKDSSFSYDVVLQANVTCAFSLNARDAFLKAYREYPRRTRLDRWLGIPEPSRILPFQARLSQREILNSMRPGLNATTPHRTVPHRATLHHIAPQRDIT